MADHTITMPYPFTMGCAHNLILCQSCGRENYVTEMFGITKNKGLDSQPYEWVSAMVRESGIEHAMVCPVCGAREDTNLGRKLMNFMIGESAREHTYPRRVAVSV